MSSPPAPGPVRTALTTDEGAAQACAICRRPVLENDRAINADGVLVHLRCAAYRRRRACR
jgi:hypothetical protein